MQIFPHELYDAAIPIGTAIVSVLGLMIRNAILGSKDELKTQMNDIGSQIKVHVAEDKVFHEGYEKRLDKIDSALERGLNKHA